jgi:phage terminase large subunit GpA-like protein
MTPSRLEQALRDVLAPDKDGDIVEWCQSNIKFVPGSFKAGGFSFDIIPYMVEPVRELQNPFTEVELIMGNVQSAKTTALEIWSAFIPVRAPGPMLLLQDVDDNAEDWYKTKLRLLWENTPATKAAMSETEKPTWRLTHFKRNVLWVLGSENDRNLQRRAIRYLGGDECWLWKKGHLSEAMKRRTTYKGMGKTLFVSQGGVSGDEFTDLWERTDRREWHWKCDACGTYQPYEWAQIKFPEGAKKDNVWNLDMVREETTYACKLCNKRYQDRNHIRASMQKEGKYISMNPNASKGRVGFHFNALAMQFGMSWGDLAVEYIEAAEALEQDGDETKMREFRQKRMEEPWSDEPHDTGAEVLPSGYRIGEIWEEEGAVIDGRITLPPFSPEQEAKPHFTRLRSMFVDCQRKGFYYVIRTWSVDGRSRLLYLGYLDTWEQVRETQLENKVAPMFTYVDSGDGPNTDEVYRKCAAFGWNATKGSGNNEFPWRIQTPVGTKIAYRPYAPAKVIQVGKQSCRLYLFSNLVLKDTLFRVRQRGEHTYPEDAGDEYRKQMQSEHRTRTETGKAIWVQVGERANHYWDCEVGGVLFALMAKLLGRGKNRNATKQVDKQEGQ